MSEPKKRPGPLWFFFHGRQRRGFPWLLIGIVFALVLLALTFAIPGAVEFWQGVGPYFAGLLVIGAILAVFAALFVPRRRR